MENVQVPAEKEEFYALKTIKLTDSIFKTEKELRIICQNRNGPCPLLALANALILRGDFTFDQQQDRISQSSLLSILGNKILESENPETEISGKLAFVSEALEVLPTLINGMDLNLKFNSVFSFENVKQMTVFDLLNVRLVHAWIPDTLAETTTTDKGKGKEIEQNDEKLDICNSIDISKESYNTLVNSIVRGREAAEEMENNADLDADKVKELQFLIEKGLKYSEFLENYPQQVSVCGLEQLGSRLEPLSIVVMFRNLHFSTLFKNPKSKPGKEKLKKGEDVYRNGEEEYQLVQLVTDIGYLDKKNIVWETVSDIYGDSAFLDGSFNPVSNLVNDISSAIPTVLANHPLPQPSEHSNDYEFALKLQQEQEREYERQVQQRDLDPHRQPHDDDDDVESKKDFLDKLEEKCTIS